MTADEAAPTPDVAIHLDEYGVVRDARGRHVCDLIDYGDGTFAMDGAALLAALDHTDCVPRRSLVEAEPGWERRIRGQALREQRIRAERAEAELAKHTDCVPRGPEQERYDDAIDSLAETAQRLYLGDQLERAEERARRAERERDEARDLVRIYADLGHHSAKAHIAALDGEEQ